MSASSSYLKDSVHNVNTKSAANSQVTRELTVKPTESVWKEKTEDTAI